MLPKFPLNVMVGTQLAQGNQKQSRNRETERERVQRPRAELKTGSCYMSWGGEEVVMK